MINKEEWNNYSKQQKVNKITELLQALNDVKAGKHELYGTSKAGGLPKIRLALEQDIFNIFDLETGKEV